MHVCLCISYRILYSDFNIRCILKSMYAGRHVTGKFDYGQVASLSHFYDLPSGMMFIHMPLKLPRKIGQGNTLTFKAPISHLHWNANSKEGRQSPSSIQIDCLFIPLTSHIHSPYSLTVHELMHVPCNLLSLP